jgi:hypothetical protein
MSPLIPSNRDLSFDGNLTQARYELLKAIDQGGEAEQAAWTRSWGEATLSRAEDATDSEDGWDFFGPSSSLVEAAEEASHTANSLAAILAGETPDLTLARQRMTALSSLITTINTKLEAEEQ